MFKRALLIFVLVITGVGSLSIIVNNISSRPVIASVPAPTGKFCNEVDLACRKMAEQRLKAKRDYAEKWEYVRQNPEEFCNVFLRGQIWLGDGKPINCRDDDPAYQTRKAVRDGVRDALRR